MTPLIFSAVVASVVTVIMIMSKSKENEESTVSYGIKTFIITFLTVFVAHTYLMADAASGQEIDIGEPPF